MVNNGCAATPHGDKMPNDLVRTDDEIESAIRRLATGIAKGDRYLEGARDAIDWLLGDWDDEDGPLVCGVPEAK